MKFLIDNNLSPKLAAVIQSSFQGSVHVADLGLDEDEDLVVWEYATRNQFPILTKDADYNNIQQLKGFPPKVVWIRSGNVSTQYIRILLQAEQATITAFLKNNKAGILEIR